MIVVDNPEGKIAIMYVKHSGQRNYELCVVDTI